MTHAGKMSRNAQIFKNELFLFSHSPLKYLQIIYDLLESDKKLLSYSHLKAIEAGRSDFEKNLIKDYKAKSPSNVAYFPPILFLIIITILLITI